MAATSEMRRSRKHADTRMWVCKDRHDCERRVSDRKPQQLGLLEDASGARTG
jgi:hypothetical protein